MWNNKVLRGLESKDENFYVLKNWDTMILIQERGELEFPELPKKVMKSAFLPIKKGTQVIKFNENISIQDDTEAIKDDL